MWGALKKKEQQLTERNRPLCSIHIATPNLLSALLSSDNRGSSPNRHRRQKSYDEIQCRTPDSAK